MCAQMHAVQVSIAGMDVLVILIGRMKDKFRPHIPTGQLT